MKKSLSSFAKTAIFSVICATLCACGGISPNYYPLSNDIATKSPRSVSEVEIFITKKPDFKYKEMGMITYEVPSSFSDEPLVYDAMRAKAAEIGADAIIIMNPQSTLVNTSKISLDYYGNPIETDSPRAYIKYRAMAISKN